MKELSIPVSKENYLRKVHGASIRTALIWNIIPDQLKVKCEMMHGSVANAQNYLAEFLVNYSIQKEYAILN